MKPLILVCEDNPDVLYNIEMTLEFHDYDVITTTDGKDAINFLEATKRLPQLILSDIMMPEMDGYDLFRKVSENPKWSLIPFLFLSARASPEDVRFGKMLGIDDYITKPFKKEDLLATIAGKIARKKKIDVIEKQIEKKIMSSLKIDSAPSLSEGKKDSVSLLLMSWDESLGPEMKSYYTKSDKDPSFLEEIGNQLFHSAISIYGQTGFYEAQSILLNIENIGECGYVFFDSRKDNDVRGGYRLFLIAVLAPKINYFESMKIKEIFTVISNKLKKIENWNNWPIGEYSKDITRILSTSVFETE